MADLSVFERLKSKQDYDRMEQEFQLKKQLAQAELKKQSYFDVDKIGEQAFMKAAMGQQLSPQEQAAMQYVDAKSGGIGFDLATQRMYQKPRISERMGVQVGVTQPNIPASGQNEPFLGVQPISLEDLNMGPENASVPKGPVITPNNTKYDQEFQSAMDSLSGNPRAQQELVTDYYKQKAIKPKLTSTDMSEIYGAGDVIAQSKSALSALMRAKALLDLPEASKPFSGYGAATASYINDIPVLGAVIPDERAAATTEYDTLIKENALSSMKAIFGGNPTEGERQILLELQAISGYRPEKQKRVLENAIAAANRRIEFNKQKIKGIQSNDFSFATGDDSNQPPPTLNDKMSIEETIFNAKKAIKAGKSKDAIRKRLMEAGIDPAKAGL
jgi:hypothetical protein